MRCHRAPDRGWWALLLAIAMAFPAMAMAREPRLALVVANGNYAAFDRLSATATDGDRIAAALNQAGFADASGQGPVVPRRDLTLAQMRDALAQFRAALQAAGPQAFGVLYFSGHGAALASYGDVIALPIDAGASLSPEMAGLTRAELTRSLLGTGAHTTLIILDMCRSVLAEPPAALVAPQAAALPADPAAGPTRGLTRMVRRADVGARAEQGYLVAFSTSADQVAFDDGTFSRVLAEEIRRPQQSIATALKRTSDRVVANGLAPGGHVQKPTFDYGLTGDPPCFITCDPAGIGRFYDCAECPWMRVVPAGTALIGSPAAEPGRGRDEPLPHEEPIGHGFAIGVYEVTIAEWAACVRDGACRRVADWHKDNPNPQIPATGLGHADALAFVGWLRRQTGLAYRLPSGTEWEYADRAGATTAFPWGDAITPGDANYDQTARYQGSPVAPYRGYPEAVNAYAPNGFGLYQMNGNAWEWTADCADPRCTAHLARGGSFQSTPAELRSANRLALADDRHRDDMGLRVVRDLRPDEGMP